MTPEEANKETIRRIQVYMSRKPRLDGLEVPPDTRLRVLGRLGFSQVGSNYEAIIRIPVEVYNSAQGEGDLEAYLISKIAPPKSSEQAPQPRKKTSE